VVFLQRVWSEPLHHRTRMTSVGQRLATTFAGLWSAGVLVNALGAVFEVDVPPIVGVVLYALTVTCLLATLAVAFRVPAGPAR
jgi:hypothetical protein